MLEDQVAVLKRKLDEKEQQIGTHAETRAREVERERQQVAKLNRQLEASLTETEARVSAGEMALDGTKRELSELREAHSKLLASHKAQVAKAKEAAAKETAAVESSAVPAPAVAKGTAAAQGGTAGRCVELEG